MHSFLNDNKLLYSKQSGFMSMHSATVTFINPKKAFDTVNHEILLKSVYLYGIKDKELCWFQPYLSTGSNVVR